MNEREESRRQRGRAYDLREVRSKGRPRAHVNYLRAHRLLVTHTSWKGEAEPLCGDVLIRSPIW